jgi:hypothetical protein
VDQSVKALDDLKKELVGIVEKGQSDMKDGLKKQNQGIDEAV